MYISPLIYSTLLCLSLKLAINIGIPISSEKLWGSQSPQESYQGSQTLQESYQGFKSRRESDQES